MWLVYCKEILDVIIRLLVILLLMASLGIVLKLYDHPHEVPSIEWEI